MRRPDDMTPEEYEHIRVIKPPDYLDRYREFLGRTDEKQVLAAALSRVLLPGSVLDVGAGTGDIPLLMGMDPGRYTAVEQQPVFAKQLRDAGFRVVEDLFPCPVPDLYRNVILCYCLYGRVQTSVMIRSAWQVVDRGGALVVVTFRDNLDDYNRLLHRVGHTRRGAEDSYFNFLRSTFTSLGQTKLHTATSHILGPDIATLADAVSFMATNTKVGTVERRREIRDAIIADREYLDQRYRGEDGGYRFPIRHYVFVIRRA